MVLLRDVLLRSNQGKAYFTDPIRGGTKVLFNAKKIEASFNIESNKYLELGKLTYGHYSGAVEITGNFDLYIYSSYFIERVNEYREGGEPFYFDLHVENGVTNKEVSKIGVQHVIFKNVTLTNVPITSLGQDASASSGNYTFQAEDLLLSSKFNEINSLE